MPNLLFRIMSQLRDVVERSSFTLVDPVDTSDTSQQHAANQAAIQMLCYRKLQPGAPTMLLELCHLPGQRWITATLWRPDDLPTRKQVVSVDEVALRHQSWGYDQPTDLEPLAGAIATEITRWLAQPGCGETSAAQSER